MKIGKKIIELKDSKGKDRKTICEGTEVHVNTIKKIEETNDGVLSKILKIFKLFGYNKAELHLYKKGEKKSEVIKLDMKK